jgi:hypothetical protein
MSQAFLNSNWAETRSCFHGLFVAYMSGPDNEGGVSKAPEGNAVKTLEIHTRTTANGISTEARQSNKRRSTRVVIDFPVTVFGQNLEGKIFVEETKTVTVNAHGALIILKTNIDPQKPVLLANTKIGLEVQCHIAFRKDSKKDEFEVGLEFTNPHPKFWGMNFPPEDWDPAYRKKATSPQRPSSPSKTRIK